MSGLAALLGFLLGLFVGFGAGSMPAGESEPRVTVTIEDTEPPADPQETVPSETLPPQPTETAPTQTGPPQTEPSQTGPPQTGLPQTGPTQTAPGQTGAPPGGATTTPAGNPVSLRTLAVGTDIQPGTYRTAGPAGGFSMCFWARLRTTTGDVIATGMPSGPATVTIQATDKAFQTGGCAEWTRA
ncbi:hypothetical protein ITP53_46535 [Nonomuraea sp. K274]|uniref:Uncharacterized protein n=1 Tax=Nonomuraea cypriaca TaxID=1187855 RepID=A0A931F2I6_9ACTN|nr:hypothetical protein [Nonomuraea cypriaca]MBF8193009.1 hypothetical protein [Nonomuraea cypriaca]